MTTWEARMAERAFARSLIAAAQEPESDGFEYGETLHGVDEGTCDLCGQRMLRTDDDCWHPWNVERACPPEPAGTSPEWGDWYMAGNRTGRPGREYFIRQ